MAYRAAGAELSNRMSEKLASIATFAERAPFGIAVATGVQYILQYVNPAFRHLTESEGSLLSERPFIEAFPDLNRRHRPWTQRFTIARAFVGRRPDSTERGWRREHLYLVSLVGIHRGAAPTVSSSCFLTSNVRRTASQRRWVVNGLERKVARAPSMSSNGLGSFVYPDMNTTGISNPRRANSRTSSRLHRCLGVTAAWPAGPGGRQAVR